MLQLIHHISDHGIDVAEIGHVRLDAVQHLAGNRDVALAPTIALNRHVAADDLLLAMHLLGAAKPDAAQATAANGLFKVGRTTSSHQCRRNGIDLAGDGVAAIVEIERADVGLIQNLTDAIGLAGFDNRDGLFIGAPSPLVVGRGLPVRGLRLIRHLGPVAGFAELILPDHPIRQRHQPLREGRMKVA